MSVSWAWPTVRAVMVIGYVLNMSVDIVSMAPFSTTAGSLSLYLYVLSEKSDAFHIINNHGLFDPLDHI